MEGPGFVRRGHQQERKVFLNRAACQYVEPADVKAARGDLLLTGYGLVNRHFVRAFPVPARRYTEGDGPVSVVLPDGRIPVIHQLVAVVFELLPEVIEHGPSLMTGRTAQPIFTGESGKGVGVVNKASGEKSQ